MSAPVTTYLEAIRLALGDALAADPRVFLYGQDIAGPFGGAFKATKGLSERFPGRVLNSPISEDAMAGVAAGAALAGALPVIEYQFADFASVAFNQIVNQLGTTYWRTGRPCPAVLRLPGGGTPGGGPFHSQMPEAWLTHHPGLVVVAPATVADAYWMLRDSIALPDPVLYIERKFLYHHLKASFAADQADAHLPLGAAAVRRPGSDVTLISYSGMVHTCLAAAETLIREHGINAEVLDLRCLRPLDTDAIVASVARTNRVVLVTEAWPYGGVVAEVLSVIATEAFQHLDAPPRRLCAEDAPVPYHPDLFNAHHPDAARVVDAVLATVAF
jgi:pyruvate dehydrogenase E1 component beta subunit/2-oxoisovalerate dehydrogenase E1 component beta subunit